MGEGLKNRIQADQRWLGPGARRLLAILANPPQATSGDRTYRRVAMASALLGCDEAAIVNLLGIPSRDVTAIGVLGRHSAAWAAARPAILLELGNADEVLHAPHHRGPATSPRGILDRVLTP